MEGEGTWVDWDCPELAQEFPGDDGRSNWATQGPDYHALYWPAQGYVCPTCGAARHSVCAFIYRTYTAVCAARVAVHVAATLEKL